MSAWLRVWRPMNRSMAQPPAIHHEQGAAANRLATSRGASGSHAPRSGLTRAVWQPFPATVDSATTAATADPGDEVRVPYSLGLRHVLAGRNVDWRSWMSLYTWAVGLLAAGLCLITVSVALGVTAGLRVDAAMSVVSTAEQVIIWGSLVTGAVLVGVAVVLTLWAGRPRPR